MKGEKLFFLVLVLEKGEEGNIGSYAVDSEVMDAMGEAQKPHSHAPPVRKGS